MNSIALVMLLVTQGTVTAATLYFLYKVLNSSKK